MAWHDDILALLRCGNLVMVGMAYRPGRGSGLWLPVCIVLALLTISPARSQDRRSSAQPGYSVDLSTPFQGRPPAGDDTNTDRQKVGSVATSSVGAAGQRQENNQSVANIKPMARIDTRIANRVQSRVRNRIDRFYDPQANATSAFKVAADQTRQ